MTLVAIVMDMIPIEMRFFRRTLYFLLVLMMSLLFFVLVLFFEGGEESLREVFEFIFEVEILFQEGLFLS